MSYRTLVQDQLFTEQCQALGNPVHVDEALNGLSWALATKPEVYEIVPNTSRLRLAKTKPYQRGDTMIPALKVWFSIEDDTTVRLRAITDERGANVEEEGFAQSAGQA